jgi:hypothetical protein
MFCGEHRGGGKKSGILAPLRNEAELIKKSSFRRKGS